MDSKVVSAELRRVVRPLLREAGFHKFTGRTAWRVGERASCVVNFQSFNRHTADAVGCTTFSFAVNLGLDLASHRLRPGTPRNETPPEWGCTFRFRLLKTLPQPWFRPHGTGRATDRRDTWFVQEDGSNLAELVAHAEQLIRDHGLPTLRLYEDPLYAYCALFEYSRTWPPRVPSACIEVTPCGAHDSPRWREVVLALGHELGRDPRADMKDGLPGELRRRGMTRPPA